MADVVIRQVRSANGSSPRQRDTLRTLRLGRIGRSVTRSDDEHTRGLLRNVSHLVSVEAAGKGA